MGHADPQVLSVNLTMTPELAGELARETGALAVAQAYVVDCAEMAVAANNELRACKARTTRLRELKAGFVAPAKQIIANAEALFDPAIEANIKAETYLKNQLTEFKMLEDRRAEEARRARVEEERRLRQEAEAKAAAERARAEEQAAAARKLAEEAEAKRLAAIAEGNKRAAAAAAAEKAKQEEKAQAAIETGEAKAQSAVLAASAAPTTTVIPARTELDGFSTRDNWVAELLPDRDEDGVKFEIANAIAGGRTDLLALFKLDMAAANRLAKAQKKAMKVPGLQAVNRPVAASRAA
jgi:hypothetical protein